MPSKKTATPLPDALGHAITDKRLLILRSLSQAGSISQAAREAGVSYKAAWQAIDTLSNLSGVALVEKVVGGAGGGGARLTPAGVQLLDAAQKLGTVRKQLLADMSPANAKNNIPPTSMALAVRTSMRNQLIAKVMAVKTVGALAWVKLQITQDVEWVAKITKESAQLLDLVPGMQIMLLCKATAVRISRLQIEKPGTNKAYGKVTRHSRAKVTEISLQSAPHVSLIGFAEDEQIKTGESLYAYLEDSSLVLALV
jgi:molybdate transport system regulatory protein